MTVRDVLTFFEPVLKNVPKSEISSLFICHEIPEIDSMDLDDERVQGLIADILYFYVLEASYDFDAKDFCGDIAISMRWSSIKELKAYLMSDIPYGECDKDIRMKYSANIDKNL